MKSRDKLKKKKSKNQLNSFLFTKILIIIVLALLLLNLRGDPLRVDKPDNVIYDQTTNILDLSSLTLKQKIAQMIITYGKDNNYEIYQDLLVGGIYLDAKESKKDYQKIITKFQNKAVIPFFVTADLEGCINPFENFKEFPTQKEIRDKQEAYEVGSKAGKLLQELGFNLNFAPVVDLKDNVLNCRNFEGGPEEVSEKAVNYITGLQQNGVLAVAKHYPGKTLAGGDSHLVKVDATITKEDLLPFEKSMKEGVSAIMVSHLVVDGLVDSGALPSTVSKEIVKDVHSKFDGLVISDEIGMLGLATNYPSYDVNKMFVDLFQAGHDLILNFDRDPRNIFRMINAVERAVKKGDVSEEKIDNSVRKILEMKGIEVI